MTITEAKKLFGINGVYTIDELKSIYYRLAKKEHPDISSDDKAEEKMKLINEAYDILKSNSNVIEEYNDFYKYKQNVIKGIKKYIEVDDANDLDLKYYGYDIFLKIKAKVNSTLKEINDAVSRVDIGFKVRELEMFITDQYRKLKNKYCEYYEIKIADHEVIYSGPLSEFLAQLQILKYDYYDNMTKEIVGEYKLYSGYNDIEQEIEKLRVKAFDNISLGIYNNKEIFNNLKRNIINLFDEYTKRKKAYLDFLKENENISPEFEVAVKELESKITCSTFYDELTELKMQIKSQTPENRYLKLYKKIITKATKFLLKLNPFDNQNKVQVLFLLQLIKEKFESYGKNELSFQNLCKLEKINFIDLAEDFKIIETIDGTKYDLNYGNNNSELVLNNEIEEIYHNLIVKAGKALIKLNPLDDSFSIAMILIQLTDINRIFDEFKYGFIDFDNLLKLNEINFNDYKADNGIISNIERTLGIKKSR